MKKAILWKCGILILVVAVIYSEYLFSPALTKSLKVGTTYMTMNNEFYKVIDNEITNYVNAHSGRVYTRDPTLNVDKQVAQIDDLIKLGINVLIIDPVDGYSKKIEKAIGRAKAAHCYVIVIDTPMQNSKNVDVTIASDNYKAGVMCAKRMMKRQSSAKIFLLEHHKAISGTQRIRGFEDTIRGHKNYQVVSRADCNGQTMYALSKTRSFINKHISFDTVMALNDPSVLGALAALDEKNRSDVSLYSVDGAPDLKKILSRNKNQKTFYVATAAQSPIEMGKKAAAAAFNLIHGKKLKSNITVPVYMIDKNNIDDQSIEGWQ